MRRIVGITAALVALLAIASSPARAAEVWHSDQPVAGAGGTRLPLGPVGDIEFWAPNRGLLITGGNDAMPAGLYAYDGVNWYLYSTVCGGGEGRIAWVGPDEFWTVSDQRAGQTDGLGQGKPDELVNRSLCHFKDGRVVASYAEPVGLQDSYEQMSSAACDGPAGCWFGGRRLPVGAVNAGAFHLRWDGEQLEPVPSLVEAQPQIESPPRAVGDLTFFQRQLFESVQVQTSDPLGLPGEPDPQQPSFLHLIEPSAPNPFVQLFTPGPLSYGSTNPAELGAFRFAGDDDGLWAVAGAASGSKVTPVLLHREAGEFVQVPLLDTEGKALKSGQPLGVADRVAGAAVEPGGVDIWVSFRHSNLNDASSSSLVRLARVGADGTVEGEVTLPAGGEGIARKGFAGPVACSAADQCWVASSRGWLFHLGGPVDRDTDPAWHPPVIDFRPRDDGSPFEQPDELPADDSGADLPPEGPLAPEREKRPRRPRARTLVAGVHQRMLGRTLLQFTFTLRARARVRLLAKRRGRTVADTGRRRMARGRRQLRLRLDPKRWPTSLDLQAHAIRARRGSPGTLRSAAASPAPSPPEESVPSTRTAPALPPPALASGAGLPPGSPVAQPDLAAPTGIRLIGASQDEEPGEIWGISGSGRGNSIYRYSSSDWEEIEPLGPGGDPVTPGLSEGALAGDATPVGGVAIAASVAGAKTLLLRDPGGPLRVVPAPDPSLLRNAKAVAEQLYGAGGSGVKLATVDGTGGKTEAFVVPTPANNNAIQDGLLYFDGESWARERICLPSQAPPECKLPESKDFRVLAVDAVGTENAWLLTKGAVAGDGLELFSREAGGDWRKVELGGALGARYAKSPAAGVPAVSSVVARTGAQALTVTPDAVWIDATLTVGGVKFDATTAYDVHDLELTGSWCDAPAAAKPMCAFELGAELQPGEGRSFAWADGGAFGSRTITGLGQGAMLVLDGSEFRRVPVGAGAGGAQGAALAGPEDGWLGTAAAPLQLTQNPEPSRLEPWPVPFRRPLTALAAEPGAPVGGSDSEALGVGDDGQVARYIPGQGWVPEALLTGSGGRATPRLRGVAWPEPDRAHAVGDDGAMWLWRAATELWEPDPGAPPNLIRGNFTGIGFDPSDPSRGYAVGKQGLLLRYGRQWEQEQLPAGIDPEVNFTSISFAGHQALATFKVPFPDAGGNRRYKGGLLVNDGSGWRVDQGAEQALQGTIPQRVAGLPDGGAVVVAHGANLHESGGGSVIARQFSGASWQRTGAAPGYPTALAAIREGPHVRALAAFDMGLTSNSGSGAASNDLLTDLDQAFTRPPAGQAPLLTPPYPLPSEGFVMRQTGAGWRDEQRQVLPSPRNAGNAIDVPMRPDPVFALLVDAGGSQGWAVGGETGSGVPSLDREHVQTGGVMRYGSAATPSPNVSGAPIVAPPGTTFAIAGQAQCAGPCADLAGTGIGPDRWLPSAIARAGEIPGVRAFVYSGPGVASSARTLLGARSFAAEVRRYAGRLSTAAGSLPVFAALTDKELDGSDAPRALFDSAFSGFPAPLGDASSPGIAPASEAVDASRSYYSFDAGDPDQTVRVIVLDYSADTLEKSGKGQTAWLEQQLAAAKAAGDPAIVVGNRGLSSAQENPAADGSQVASALLSGGASAYFFDSPGQNREYRLGAGGRSIPVFSSGTLGYDGSFPRPNETDFVGASGFLLATVDVDGRDEATNVAPVTASLIPNVGELALDAADGTLLRRSRPALFEALARRPRAGWRCTTSTPGFCSAFAADPYIPIPAKCKGIKCGSGIFPEYSFTSSNPDIADFVRTDPASTDPRRVLLGANDKPIPDSSSGLLCPYNAGTTTVTVAAGGFAYSTEVTVRPGSVQRPCGTVPLRNPPTRQPQLAAPPPPPAPAPGPGFTPTASSLPPPPPPPPAAQPTPAPKPLPKPVVQPQPLPFFAPTPALTPVVAIVPPPPPPAAQTTPPSGTSPVTQPVTSPSPEDEDEVAVDIVHHMAAYEAESQGGESGGVAYLPALAILVALGLAVSLRRPRRDDRRFAYATSRSTTPRRRRR